MNGPPPARDADLRLRLLAALVLTLGAVAFTGLPVALAGLAAAVALAVAMRASPRAALRRMGHVEGFLLVLLIFLPFTTPGRTILRLGPLAASAEGLHLALLIVVKVNTVALVILALLGGAPPERLGRALLALGCPERFVRLLELLLRHSHTARDSLRRQSEAMRARAFAPRSSLHTWRSYGHLFGGALLRAFDRAQRVDEAMRMRGSGRLAHAALPPFGARAWGLLGAAAGAAALAVLADRLS